MRRLCSANATLSLNAGLPVDTTWQARGAKSAALAQLCSRPEAIGALPSMSTNSCWECAVLNTKTLPATCSA